MRVFIQAYLAIHRPLTAHHCSPCPPHLPIGRAAGMLNMYAHVRLSVHARLRAAPGDIKKRINGSGAAPNKFVSNNTLGTVSFGNPCQTTTNDANEFFWIEKLIGQTRHSISRQVCGGAILAASKLAPGCCVRYCLVQWAAASAGTAHLGSLSVAGRAPRFPHFTTAQRRSLTVRLMARPGPRHPPDRARRIQLSLRDLVARAFWDGSAS